MEKITVKGIEYPSIVSACRCLDRMDDYQRILNAISNGMNPDDAFVKSKKYIPKGRVSPKTKKSKSVICPKGVEYASIKDMCEAYGIDHMLYRNRVSIGWSMKEALTIKKKRVNNRPSFDWNRRVFGIPLRLIIPNGNFRLKFYNFKYNSDTEYLYNSTEDIVDWILNKWLFSINKNYCGVTKDGVVILRNDKGFIHQSFQEYLNISFPITCHNGIGFTSIRELCKHYDIAESTYYHYHKIKSLEWILTKGWVKK